MTAQEIFDRVWTHFVVEGNPRSINDCGCAYRGHGGAKCAVGVLIPDEEYAPSFEGLSVESFFINPDCPPSIAAMKEHVGLLGALQGAHDSAGSPAALSVRLRGVAARYSIALPKVSP
jgi:hypothetical protein